MQQPNLTALAIQSRNAINRFSQQTKRLAMSLFELVILIFQYLVRASLLVMDTVRYLVAHLDRAFTRFARHPLFDRMEASIGRIIGHGKNQYYRAKGLVLKSALYQKLRLYAQLTRLDKPIGTLLLMWPTLIALWLAAGGWPDPLVLFVFITGVILMRSAGCAINDYADRKIDGQVKRTTQRPLATGKLQAKEALLVFAALSATAFALVLLMNPLTIMLAMVGVALAASYPFMKRYHYLPQVHLGAAFGWAAPMAYAAQAGEVNEITWLIFLATVLWATVYDTMYAMVDYDDDIRIGVKSTAILFGNQDKLIIGIIQILLILNLILIGHRAGLSGFYYLGVAAASVFAIYQQYLIRHRIREQCFKAFLNNNWFGLVLFAGVVLDLQFSAISH
jgi:4-hydroxybenzoate polyprenyltransferase